MTRVRVTDVMQVVLEHLRSKNVYTVSTVRPDEDAEMPYVHVMLTGGPIRLQRPLAETLLTFDVYGLSHGQVSDALLDIEEWIEDLPHLANPIGAVYGVMAGQLPDMHLGRAVHTSTYRFRTILETKEL